MGSFIPKQGVVPIALL